MIINILWAFIIIIVLQMSNQVEDWAQGGINMKIAKSQQYSKEKKKGGRVRQIITKQY